VKIVDVCEFYSPDGGGVRTYVHAKLALGGALGHEVVVIAPSDRDDEVAFPGGGRLLLVKSPRLPFDPRYFMFWDAAPVHRLLDAERPDLLEASSPWRGAWIARAWRGEAVRALFMHHDPLSAWAYRWLCPPLNRAQADRCFAWFWRYLRRMSEGFELVVCPAPSLARRLAAGGIAGTVTVPLGVDAGMFSPMLRDPDLRASLLRRCGLGETATLLLAIGRHTPEKRWPCVIDAVAAVAAERPVGLVLIGAGHQQAKILAHIGDNPHVQALQPIRDRALLARVMASADALIHGSAAETFGLVASEALASGLPLIVPNEGAVADIARPAFAETYAPGDARDAAAAIRRLLDRESGALREATLRAALATPTIDDHVRSLFAAYEAAVRRSRAHAAPAFELVAPAAA
jgi:alpha-1,6-mannosyltransferase